MKTLMSSNQQAHITHTYCIHKTLKAQTTTIPISNRHFTMHKWWRSCATLRHQCGKWWQQNVLMILVTFLKWKETENAQQGPKTLLHAYTPYLHFSHRLSQKNMVNRHITTLSKKCMLCSMCVGIWYFNWVKRCIRQKSLLRNTNILNNKRY